MCDVIQVVLERHEGPKGDRSEAINEFVMSHNECYQYCLGLQALADATPGTRALPYLPDEVEAPDYMREPYQPVLAVSDVRFVAYYDPRERKWKCGGLDYPFACGAVVRQPFAEWCPPELRDVPLCLVAMHRFGFEEGARKTELLERTVREMSRRPSLEALFPREHRRELCEESALTDPEVLAVARTRRSEYARLEVELGDRLCYVAARSLTLRLATELGVPTEALDTVVSCDETTALLQERVAALHEALTGAATIGARATRDGPDFTGAVPRATLVGYGTRSAQELFDLLEARIRGLQQRYEARGRVVTQRLNDNHVILTRKADTAYARMVEANVDLITSQFSTVPIVAMLLEGHRADFTPENKQTLALAHTAWLSYDLPGAETLRDLTLAPITSPISDRTFHNVVGRRWLQWISDEEAHLQRLDYEAFRNNNVGSFRPEMMERIWPEDLYDITVAPPRVRNDYKFADYDPFVATLDKTVREFFDIPHDTLREWTRRVLFHFFDNGVSGLLQAPNVDDALMEAAKMALNNMIEQWSIFHSNSETVRDRVAAYKSLTTDNEWNTFRTAISAMFEYVEFNTEDTRSWQMATNYRILQEEDIADPKSKMGRLAQDVRSRIADKLYLENVGMVDPKDTLAFVEAMAWALRMGYLNVDVNFTLKDVAAYFEFTLEDEEARQLFKEYAPHWSFRPGFDEDRKTLVDYAVYLREYLLVPQFERTTTIYERFFGKLGSVLEMLPARLDNRDKSGSLTEPLYKRQITADQNQVTGIRPDDRLVRTENNDWRAWDFTFPLGERPLSLRTLLDHASVMRESMLREWTDAIDYDIFRKQIRVMHSRGMDYYLDSTVWEARLLRKNGRPTHTYFLLDIVLSHFLALFAPSDVAPHYDIRATCLLALNYWVHKYRLGVDFAECWPPYTYDFIEIDGEWSPGPPVVLTDAELDYGSGTVHGILLESAVEKAEERMPFKFPPRKGSILSELRYPLPSTEKLYALSARGWNHAKCAHWLGKNFDRQIPDTLLVGASLGTAFPVIELSDAHLHAVFNMGTNRENTSRWYQKFRNFFDYRRYTSEQNRELVEDPVETSTILRLDLGLFRDFFFYGLAMRTRRASFKRLAERLMLASAQASAYISRHEVPPRNALALVDIRRALLSVPVEETAPMKTMHDKTQAILAAIGALAFPGFVKTHDVFSYFDDLIDNVIIQKKLPKEDIQTPFIESLREVRLQLHAFFSRALVTLLLNVLNNGELNEILTYIDKQLAEMKPLKTPDLSDDKESPEVRAIFATETGRDFDVVFDYVIKGEDYDAMREVLWRYAALPSHDANSVRYALLLHPFVAEHSAQLQQIFGEFGWRGESVRLEQFMEGPFDSERAAYLLGRGNTLGAIAYQVRYRQVQHGDKSFIDILKRRVRALAPPGLVAARTVIGKLRPAGRVLDDVSKMESRLEPAMPRTTCFDIILSDYVFSVLYPLLRALTSNTQTLYDEEFNNVYIFPCDLHLVFRVLEMMMCAFFSYDGLYTSYAYSDVLESILKSLDGPQTERVLGLTPDSTPWEHPHISPFYSDDILTDIPQQQGKRDSESDSSSSDDY